MYSDVVNRGAMNSDISIVSGKAVWLVKSPLMRWVQLDTSQVDATYISGRFHPKLTFFYYENPSSVLCRVMDLYGNKKNLAFATPVRRFPPQDQLELIEDYGEMLAEEFSEKTIEKITQEIKRECIV